MNKIYIKNTDKGMQLKNPHLVSLGLQNIHSISYKNIYP